MPCDPMASITSGAAQETVQWACVVRDCCFTHPQKAASLASTGDFLKLSQLCGADSAAGHQVQVHVSAAKHATREGKLKARTGSRRLCHDCFGAGASSSPLGPLAQAQQSPVCTHVNSKHHQCHQRSACRCMCSQYEQHLWLFLVGEAAWASGPGRMASGMPVLEPCLG